MKRIQLILLTFTSVFIFGQAHGQITIPNGDFETNTSPACAYNMSNATFNARMSGAAAYGGGGELDIMSSCPYGTPQNGSWFVSLALPSGNPDAFTLPLSGPLTAGTTYSICYYDRGWDNSGCCPPGTPMQIGISTVAGAQGTVVYTSPTPTLNVWSQRTFTFIAPNNGAFVSFQTTGTGRWTHIDNVSMTNCGVLPAELTYFRATANPGLPTHLAWGTENETNIDHFAVERSLDGLTFEVINQVNAKGNVNAAADYTDLDAEPITETTYYKVRMMDVDGIAHNSEIVMVEPAPARLEMFVHPNPTRGRFQVSLPANLDLPQGSQIEIFDALGRLVHASPLKTMQELDLSGEKAGVYLVVVRMENEILRESVVLQ
ncbi:MAG: T9SS type A sorting domain-containing protein [Bacteroidota bacterium]